MQKRNNFDISFTKKALEKKLRVIPRKMGMLALDHFDKSFRNQGFTDTTLQPWKKTKSGKANRFGRPSQGILIGRGRLRRGTRMAAVTYNSVIIENAVEYGVVHNDGFKGTVRVPEHTRKQTFRYKYGNKKRTETRTVTVSAHTRKMNMPRRRFMGNSRMLTQTIRQMIVREINHV